MSINSNNLGPQSFASSGLPLNAGTLALKVKRAPTASDKAYPYGQLWIDLSTDIIYMLSLVSNGQAVWQNLSIGASGINTLTGDTGGAISPVAGNINLVGGPGVSVAGSGDTLTVNVFDTVEGTASTSGAVTADVITYDLGASGVYSLDIFVTGFDAFNAAGVAYAITGGVRTTGSSAVIMSAPMIDAFEESALSAAGVDLVISGNDLIIQVTGVAATNISWKARLEFVRSNS